MANSYEHLTIFLLLSLRVCGGIGSEYTYSCQLQLLNPKSTIPLGDREEGRILDCIQIGWIESQQQYGLKTGESAECSKALSSECQKTDQLTSPNDEFEFTKTIGNDTVAFKVNCKIDVDDDDERKGHINVWQCGDDVIHRYYILKSASVPESTVSKRDVMAKRCSPVKFQICYFSLSEQLERREVFAVNKDQLLADCRMLKKVVKCVKDTLKQCSESGNIEVDEMFSGFTSTVNDMCDVNSNFSRDYARFAPCMAEMDESVATCLKIKSNDHASSSDSTAITQQRCCDTKSSLTCIREIYNEHCGPEAGEMGYQMVKMMHGPVVQETCIDSYGDFKCSGCNSHFSMAPVMPLLSLATLYFIFNHL